MRSILLIIQGTDMRSLLGTLEAAHRCIAAVGLQHMDGGRPETQRPPQAAEGACYELSGRALQQL